MTDIVGSIAARVAGFSSRIELHDGECIRGRCVKSRAER